MDNFTTGKWKNILPLNFMSKLSSERCCFWHGHLQFKNLQSKILLISEIWLNALAQPNLIITEQLRQAQIE